MIDDEDKSLGNKFAVLDPDLEKVLRELNERFGPGTIQEGTEGIPTPPKTIEREMFENAFKDSLADGGRIGFNKGGDVDGLRRYLKNLPRGAEVNVKELSEKFKVSRSTVSLNRTNLRPDTKVVFNLPGTKGSGVLQEGILRAYEELGKGKNTTTADIYKKIKDLDPFKNYGRRELLTMIGIRLKNNNKPFKRTAGATSEAAEETKRIKRNIYLRKKVTQPTIVYKDGKVMNVKFPEKGNRTKAKFKKVIEDYYLIPKDDAKIRAAKNKIIKDFFPDGLKKYQWDKLVNFFTQDEGIDTKRPYKYDDEGGSGRQSRKQRKSRRETFSDKIFEDRISDEKRNIIKEKGLLKNPRFKAGYEPIDLAHRLSLASSERFGIPQRTGTIGLDRPVVNQVFVEYYQSKLNKVYNLQKELLEKRPKDFRKKLEFSNRLITSIVNDADNRIVGVTIDEKTFKPRLFGDKLAAKYAIDSGIFDTDIKKLKPQDKEFIKKVLIPDQVMREVKTGLDVKNFRNINKESLTKWMNKKKKFKKNTVLKDQALKILEDNPQITKPQGELGIKDTQPQIKSLIEKKYKSTLLNRVNSGIPIDNILSMIADDLNIPVEQVKNVAGKTLKVLGKATVAAEPVFAALDAGEAFREGLSGKQATNYVVRRFIDGVANLPALAKGGFDFVVDKARGEDAKFEMPYEVTLGKDYKDRVLEQTPEEILEARKAQLEFDQTVRPNLSMVDDIDMPASKAEIEAARNKFMDEKGVDLSVLDNLEEDKTELSPIIKSLITPDETLQDFMAHGGRAGFSNGGAAGADDNFLKELEFYFTNEDAELPKLQTYKETMNPVEVLNDIIDPRNYPYYADVLARSGLRIGEFAVRVLPATGN